MSSRDGEPRHTRYRQRRKPDARPPDLASLRASLGPPLRPERTQARPESGAKAGDPRAFCYRCHKAEVVCLCSRIRVAANRTGILIFQHPRERFHALGTARIAALSLERCRILGARWSAAGVGLAFEPPARTGVLYPGTGSTPLGSLEPDERPDHLVVLDGTWAHAHSLYRDNAWLQRLPHYALNPSEPSRYRIRQEPRTECISTIESIVCALKILEPETTGFSHLLNVFDSMIDDQIRFHCEREVGGAVSGR